MKLKVFNSKWFNVIYKDIFVWGFTLIEVIIAIAVTLVLVAAAVPLYSNLHISSQLDEASTLMIQTIRNARERSVAGLDNTSHGVFFDIDPNGADSYILYKGPSYGSDPSSYIITDLDNTLLVTTTISGGDINFSKGLGMPNITQVETITITHAAQGARTININTFGIVDLE